MIGPPMSGTRLLRPWLVVGALLLVLVGACGAFLVMKSAWGPTRAQDGQFQFVVTDVVKAAVQDGPPPKGVYYLATLTVTNTGNEPHTLLAGNQKLIDAGGHGYAAFRMTVPRMDHDTTILEMAPRVATHVIIRFDMPNGTQPTAIELHDSASSHGVTVGV